MIRRFLTYSVLATASALIAHGSGPISFPGRDAASVGIYIEDLATGKAIADHNSAIALTPASILKSVTAATALHVLGKDFQFTTDFMLIGTAPDEGKADIVIAGSGDPSMGGRDFDSSASLPSIVADELAAIGISHITGEVRIDGEVLPEGGGVVPGWEVEDITESYGAGLFPVNWMDNYFESDFIIPSPGDFFADELIAACSRKGIEIKSEYHDEESPFAEPDTTAAIYQPAANDTVFLYRHRSERLEKIMDVMMEKSVNLLAEGCLRAIAPNEPPDSAIAREKALWKSRGVSLEHTRILDGSGLARGNAISARQISGILRYMAKSDACEVYASLFPKAGKEGTVKRLLAGTRLAGRLAVKSGSMGGVHCYAGYLLGSNGLPSHTVVVMVNNFFCNRTQLRKSIERYLLNTLP